MNDIHLDSGRRGDQPLLRQALSAEADRFTPAPPPLADVARRGRAIRARRRIAVAAVIAAVAAVPVAVTALRHGEAPATSAPVAVADRPSAPVSPHHTPAPARSGPAVPKVRVVKPGVAFDIGLGQRMYLLPSERCVLDERAQPGCKSVNDGNQAPGTVGLQSYGNQHGTLYTPLYIGSGTPARITVETGGRVLNATVVTLAGHPGYASGYVVGPALVGARPKGFHSATVTVYDRSGRVLARL